MNIQDWTLYYDNLGPLSCQAPCTMYSVLYDHGKIPDPFYGTNERELQYLAEKDCVFESVFSAPPAGVGLTATRPAAKFRKNRVLRASLG